MRRTRGRDQGSQRVPEGTFLEPARAVAKKRGCGGVSLGTEGLYMKRGGWMDGWVDGWMAEGCMQGDSP